MIKEMIVVEGKDDTAAIKRAVEAETIETGGSAINEEVFRQIRIAKERRGVIILTDPDHAGERIRKMISDRVPGCKHAFIRREDAMGKRNIGVENAAPEVILQALASVKTECPEVEPDITMNDLFQAGLVGLPQSAERRKQLGDLLGIGYANGKTFYKRCAAFRITRDEFQQALMQIDSNAGDFRND